MLAAERILQTGELLIQPVCEQRVADCYHSMEPPKPVSTGVSKDLLSIKAILFKQTATEDYPIGLRLKWHHIPIAEHYLIVLWLKVVR